MNSNKLQNKLQAEFIRCKNEKVSLEELHKLKARLNTYLWRKIIDIMVTGKSREIAKKIVNKLPESKMIKEIKKIIKIA